MLLWCVSLHVSAVKTRPGISQKEEVGRGGGHIGLSSEGGVVDLGGRVERGMRRIFSSWCFEPGKVNMVLNVHRNHKAY